MAPPMQVAAPPKGSISVGWLWVSFLKSSSQSCAAVHRDRIFTVQALISSDSSSLARRPLVFFRYLGPDGAQIHEGHGLFPGRLGAGRRDIRS
jgi:hypothetical protein